jgi:hypothetical protein
MKPLLFDVPSLLLSLDATELIFRHPFSETWCQDIISRLLPSMILKEGGVCKEFEAPIAAKVRLLVYSIQVLPG